MTHIKQPTGPFSNLLASVDRRKTPRTSEVEQKWQQAQRVQTWRISDEFEFISEAKIRAMGVPESLLNGNSK